MGCDRGRSYGFRAMCRGWTGLGALVLMNGAAAPILAGAVPTAASAQQSATVAPPLVFDGVTVVDVEHGKLLPAQRVVIVGNRIQTMGDVGAVKKPKGAQIVDARGKYLIPGLWDMHVHLADAPNIAFPELIANGVTGIRDAGARTPLDTLGLRKREIAAGLRVGPRQVVSGQATDEQNPCKRDNASHHTCVSGPDDARHYVDSLKAAGADMIKTYTLSVPTYFAIAAEARRVGIPFGGHLNEVDGLVASDSGALILDHRTYFTPDVCGLYDGGLADTNTARCAAAAERLRRNHTWVTDYMAGLVNARFGGGNDSAFSAFARRALRYGGPSLYFALGEDWKPLTAAERQQLPSAADWAAVVGIDSATGHPPGCQGAAVAYAANMPLLANTDAFGPPPGSGVHMYMLFKVLCGASPLWALQTATLNPAQALRLTDSLGTVAAGKVADLVLLDGNPLADIWNVIKIRAVVANGRYFDRLALDRLLEKATIEHKKAEEAARQHQANATPASQKR